MKSKFIVLLFVSISLLNGFRCLSAENKSIDLFNGKDLLNWRYFLAAPDKSIQVNGLKRDSSGNYLEPIGYMKGDPLNVFTVVQVDNKPVIRISGQMIGTLFLPTDYKNYHLKLKFKWGTIKWSWMKGRPKDGGLLYNYFTTKEGKSFSHEFQIHEGDVGSYWGQGTNVQIPAELTTKIPTAIKTAKLYLKDLVPELKDTMLMYNQYSSLHQFKGTPGWQICLANPQNELNSGEWNILELICYENNSVHIVNGKVNMIILNAKVKEGDQLIKMDHGLIQLQSEGAEIFFKDIVLEQINEVPKVLQRYISKK